MSAARSLDPKYEGLETRRGATAGVGHDDQVFRARHLHAPRLAFVGGGSLGREATELLLKAAASARNYRACREEGVSELPF